MLLPVTREEGQAVALALGRELSSPVKANRNAHCPSHNSDTGACESYEARPQVCRDFQCNGQERFAHTAESLVKLEVLADRTEPVYDLRSFLPETVGQTLARHRNIAFQFSGGKDSTAALMLLKPYWHLFTVYFCDSGDSMEETISVVRQVAAMVPNFRLIQGRVQETRARYGMPTDLLPWTSAPAAHMSNAGYTPQMQDRVACCSRSVMAPLHARMEQDGITLIIRGQKSGDTHKGSFSSGDTVDGFEFLYPVQDWTDAQCFAFMREHGIEPQRFYSEGLTHSGDCATCTAWCEDDRATYLAKYHPLKFMEYRANMAIIAEAVAPALSNFQKELEACHGLAI